MHKVATIRVTQQCTVCGTKLPAGLMSCQFCTCPYLKSIPPEDLPVAVYLKP